MGYTASVRGIRHLSSRYLLETALMYSRRGYGFEILTPDPVASLWYKRKIHERLHYLELPLLIRMLPVYQNGITCSMGLIGSYLLGSVNKEILSMDGGRKILLTPPWGTQHRELNLSPTLSLGYIARINLRTHFYFEGVIAYGLAGIFVFPDSDQLISTGIITGLRFGE